MAGEFNVEPQPYLIYADDDPDDLLLLEVTLAAVQPSIKMQGCTSGKEVFEFLESLGEGDLFPGIILLDLNMPGWGGLQTLERLKGNRIYQDIPVFIFTNSDHPRHRASAIQLGAVDFITKPYQKADLMKVCTLFCVYANQANRLKVLPI